MKKFLAIFAAVAVVAAAGIAVIQSKKDNDGADTETTSGYSQTQQGGNYGGDYSQTNGETTAPSEEQTSDASLPADGQHSFNAQIDAVSGMMVIVLPDAGSDEYKSSDKISFSLDGIAVVDENGNTVGYDNIGNYESAKVIYSGDIRETYPAQIDAQKVVLSGRKFFNVSFVVNGETVETLNVKKGETVNAADMPNAGAYCADGYHFECWMNGDKSVSFISDISSDVTLTAKISKD